MRRALWVGLLSCSFSVAASARAAEIDARGPAECPDSAELGFRVERHLGVPLAQAPAAKFVVEMERGAAAYTARLSVLGGVGAESKGRALEGADCNELADAIVVALTLALGAAEAPAAEAPPFEAPPPLTETPPAAADTDGERPAQQQEAASPLRPSLSVAALVDVGSLPEPGLGAALGAELRWEGLQLRALATILFEQHTELGTSTGPAPGADLQLFAGSLLGCTSAVGSGSDPFTLPVCLGFELGWISGVGTGVVSPRSGSAPWAAARVDVGALWCAPGSLVCFGATLTAAAPITRSRFELTDIGTVYRPPSVTGRLSLGIGVGFD
jgi:hypothetical protein